MSFPADLVIRVDDDHLPASWDSPQPTAETQIFGDAWIREGRSAVLDVPSAVVPQERNYLINPAHEDFASMAIGNPARFRIDPRLG